MATPSTPAAAPASTTPAAPPTAALFQKAHAKMLTLARIDEQLQALLDQRVKVLDELKGVQAMINDEFNRVTLDVQASAAKPPSPNGAAKSVNRLEAVGAI